MKKFEYKVEHRQEELKSADFKQWLNKVGAEGWEVVHVYVDTMFFTTLDVILKREI